MRNLEAFLRKWLSKGVSKQLVIPYTQDRSIQFGNYNDWALPPMCLPSLHLILLHMMKPPRPSPPYSYAGNDQIPEVVGVRQSTTVAGL